MKMKLTLVNNININNKINLINNIYQISFGDNKIFIKDNINKNNSLYFIYSYQNENYELEYIILFLQNKDLYYLIQQNLYAQNFEELISNYGINMTDTNPQIIIDNDLKKIGEFFNLKSKQKILKKELNCSLGLKNIGNSAYMNATIQCICNIKKVKQYFQDKQLVYKDTNNKLCPLTKEFYNLINNLWKQSSNENNYCIPTDFKRKISEMNPLFRGTISQDPKDLILFLYETMHNEINNGNKNI